MNPESQAGRAETQTPDRNGSIELTDKQALIIACKTIKRLREELDLKDNILLGVSGSLKASQERLATHNGELVKAAQAARSALSGILGALDEEELSQPVYARCAMAADLIDSALSTPPKVKP